MYHAEIKNYAIKHYSLNSYFLICCCLLGACGQGGHCFDIPDGRGYKCACPVGKTGDRCQSGNQVLHEGESSQKHPVFVNIYMYIFVCV